VTSRRKRRAAESDEVKASEVHLPRVRDYVAQKKAQGGEVREIHCDTRGERLVADLPVRVGPDAEAGIIVKEDGVKDYGSVRASDD